MKDKIDIWLEEMDFILSETGQQCQEFIDAIENQQKINSDIKNNKEDYEDKVNDR